MNIQEIAGLVSKDEWGKANINSFSLEDFERYENLAARLEAPEDRADFRQVCEEELSKNRKSVPARVLATLSGRHPIDDHYLLEVLEAANDAKMYPVAELLANEVLRFSENDYALRILADYYEASGRTEEKIRIWERLVRADYEETEIMRKLSAHYEKAGDSALALNYCQRAAQRLLKNQDFLELKDVWPKLVQFKQGNNAYLVAQAEHYARILTAERGVFFLNDLLDRGILGIDMEIEVLKKIIRLSSGNVRPAVEKLIARYREKHRDNPRLESCLASTGLANMIPDIVETGIEQFETQIDFVKGAFVLHENWGIGRIIGIDRDNIQIVFNTKGRHSMTCAMAYASLRVLPKTDLKVLEAVIPPQKLKARFLADVTWALRTLISSNGGRATYKEMKAQAVPAVLTAKEWTAWYAQAKKILMGNANFGFSEDDIESFVYRETPSSFEEKKFNLFRFEKSFFGKMRIVRDYINNKGDVEDEVFDDMVGFFAPKARTADANVENLSSWLFLNDLKKRRNISFISLEGSFADFHRAFGDDPARVFQQIEDGEIKKAFVEELIAADPKNWPQVAKDLFPYYLNPMILEELLRNKQRKVYNSILRDAVDGAKERPEVLVYLARTLPAREWARAGVADERLLGAQIRLLNHALMCISHKEEVQRFRKVEQALSQNLFDNHSIEKFLEQSDEETARNLWTALEASEYIGKSDKSGIRTFITEKFSDYARILGDERHEAPAETGQFPQALLCTQASLDAKLAELKHIIEVEIPQNAREIGEARELGDLRENAEYQYGKDKQKNLAFLKEKLSKEINDSLVVLPSQVDATRISFGTKVRLRDNVKGKTVEYTVMGQWESDPGKNILNFKAPLCRRLYNHQEGDTIEFEMSGAHVSYTVLGIRAVEF